MNLKALFTSDTYVQSLHVTPFYFGIDCRRDFSLYPRVTTPYLCEPEVIPRVHCLYPVGLFLVHSFLFTLWLIFERLQERKIGSHRILNISVSPLRLMHIIGGKVVVYREFISY
jgi:hypothetical protein